jgi:hypothetical protein
VHGGQTRVRDRTDGGMIFEKGYSEFIAGAGTKTETRFLKGLEVPESD